MDGCLPEPYIVVPISIRAAYVLYKQPQIEIWVKLEVQFLDKTRHKKLYVRQNLYGLKIEEGVDLTNNSMSQPGDLRFRSA
jgi:hypothetical protein